MDADRFVLAAKSFESHAPGVDVERIDIDTTRGIVTVWSYHLGLLIGRRGATSLIRSDWLSARRSALSR
ncbi:MAG: hypothetical protein ABI706_07850 [Ilumatobacteraceae bacterium]